MTVLEFKRRAPPTQPADPIAAAPAVQHGHGEAFCIGCDHRWQAVVPTGTVEFECPSCRAMKGRWRFEFAPAEGQLVRQCGCGNQLFYLTPDGHLCANCGVYQSY